MYSCSVIYALPHWKLVVGPMTNLQRLRCTSLFWRLNNRNNRGCGRNRLFSSETADTDNFHRCLRIPQQRPGLLLLSNCFYLGVSRKFVEGDRHYAMNQMFTSLTRQYSLLPATPVRCHRSIQENFSCECSPACARPLMKCALLSHLPKPCRGDARMYFGIVQHQFAVERNDHSRSLSQKPDKDSRHKPSDKHLQNVQQLMTEQIPVILMQRHEYGMYTKDLVFENNWNIEKPHKIVGIGGYVMAIVKARFYFHSKFAKIKVTVLSSSIDESVGCVHFHWRIACLHQKIAFMFWKFAFFQFRRTAETISEWLEGRSTFYVNSEGFIYKHVLDRTAFDAGESHGAENEATLR